MQRLTLARRPFDLNPNTDRTDHVLNIDESDNRPSLATVLETLERRVSSSRHP
jgi:hypothetical protein